MADENARKWAPLTPDEAYRLLAGLAAPWWVAGGWALGLYLGRETRRHGDLDVLIRRNDQLLLQRHLAGWDLHKTKQPGLKPWSRDEYLAPPINDIWCRRAPDSPWCMQLMLIETVSEQWVFRRNPSIGGPVSQLGRKTAWGIPYLAPEIQLLYKANPAPLAKDDADFAAVLPVLAQSAREWLLHALRQCLPETHPWVVQLKAA
jgi:hypothetical protein